MANSVEIADIVKALQDINIQTNIDNIIHLVEKYGDKRYTQGHDVGYQLGLQTGRVRPQ